MKKLFTIDNFIVPFISAIGSGLGCEISRVLGYEEWQCSVISLIVGVSLGELAGKILFSKVVQSNAVNRYLIFVAYILVFVAFESYAVSQTGISFYNYFVEETLYVIAPAVLSFAFTMIVQWYRVRQIREQYGDGSGGFVFNDLLEQSDLVEELQQQNQQIHGSFDAELAVKTKTGFFVGDKIDDALFFCGIPYAKPPVGKLRWKAPEPLPESEDVFEAKYFGASAIQVDYEGSVLQHHRQSEDCLTLNICTGSERTAQKKPVIVIFHHGDFSYGGSADPILYGGEFNKIYPDAIAVSFNYRLGILGFIDFSEVPGGEDYPDALNLGLLDQIAALKWIKENISAFGGDPKQITVMGFESGALSIALLAASAQAKGLFQKALIFHGNPLGAYATPEVSRNLARKLLQETSTKTMAELMQLPTERLKEATQKLALDLSAPTRDGKLIPKDVYAAYQKGTVAGVEFLIGIPGNERQVYKSAVGHQKYADFMSKEVDYITRYLDANYPDTAKAVKDYLDKETAATSELEAKAELYEQLSALGSYQFAKKLSESGNQVHLFYWDVKPLIENLGSGTVDVLAAFLGNREAAQMYGNLMNKDIAETLQTLFRKFQSGDELQLFNNEIKGVAAIDWQEFPKALIVSEEEFKCEPIADQLTEVKGLLKIFVE